MRADPNLGLARSVTAEITVHLVVLSLVLAPILILLFPAMLAVLSITVLMNLAAPNSEFASVLSGSGSRLLLYSCVAALVIGVIAALWRANRPDTAFIARLRKPTGRDGQRLLEIVSSLWGRLADGTPPPAVCWFPAMDIAAYAAQGRAGPELHVSAGMWRAVVSGQPIALAILAHEIAHLRYRDTWTLRGTELVATAAQAVLVLSGAAALVTLAGVLLQDATRLIEQGLGAPVVLLSALRILAASAVILILLPLGWLALRRQVAFITSLVEIRADVAGANWTGGLEAFTQLFAESKGVVRSTNRDLLLAILSPRLTHIPERERLHILRDPTLIITPKLRFFAMSILLIFLLPINFATPLLFGGAANYLAMLGLAAALNAAMVAMLLCGAGPAHPRLTSSRRLVLTLASCVVTSLPRMNVEPASYLPMSWLVGFGGQAMDWKSLPEDLWVTATDLSEKAATALVNVHAALALPFTFVGVTLLSMLARNASRLGPYRPAIPVLAAILGTAVAAVDDFRAPAIGAVEAIRETLWMPQVDPAMFLFLPLLAAAGADLLQQVLVRRRG